MEAFVKKLQGQLEKDLNSVDAGKNAVKGHDHRVKLTRQAIDSLKEYIFEHPFPDQVAEIHYFKDIAPRFYSQHLYFIKLYNLELCRISSLNDEFIIYVDHELLEVGAFFRNCSDFCKYFYSGNSFLDEKYFTRNAQEHWIDDLSAVIDEDFCLASYRASLILTNERYRKHLVQELRNTAPSQIDGCSTVKWMGTVSEAVELLVALQESGLIEVDNQPATLIQLKERFQVFVDIDIKDINSTDYANRQKKKQPTPFLTKLNVKYTERMNRLLGSSQQF